MGFSIQLGVFEDEQLQSRSARLLSLISLFEEGSSIVNGCMSETSAQPLSVREPGHLVFGRFLRSVRVSGTLYNAGSYVVLGDQSLTGSFEPPVIILG